MKKVKHDQDGPARFAPKDYVEVNSMPSYGAMPVRTAKHSPVSGWWYELVDENGGVWLIPQDDVKEATR